MTHCSGRPAPARVVTVKVSKLLVEVPRACTPRSTRAAGCCSFHFAFLARFATRPTEEAWAALVVLLCFMYHTRRRHVLNYTRKQPAMPHLPSCKPPLDPKVYTKLRGLLVVSDDPPPRPVSW